jgi:hypothetical protein
MLSSVLGIQQFTPYNGIALPLLCHSLEFILLLGSHNISEDSSSRGCLKIKIETQKKKIQKRNEKKKISRRKNSKKFKSLKVE